MELKDRISELEEANSIILDCLNTTMSYFESLLMNFPDFEEKLYIAGVKPRIVLQNLRFKLSQWINIPKISKVI